MKTKNAKKKSDFLKIAQSLGIVIPASLLFATNVDATPVNTIDKGIESSINLQEENEIMERIAQTLTVVGDDYLLADVTEHIDRHSDHSDHGDGTVTGHDD